MNRRTLFSKLAALPFIGFLFRPVEAKAKAVVPLIPFENKSIWMLPLSWQDFDGSKRDDLMIDLGNGLTLGINTILKECQKDGVPLQDITIRWANIPTDHNPDGQIGRFVVTALRGTQSPGFPMKWDAESKEFKEVEIYYQ